MLLSIHKDKLGEVVYVELPEVGAKFDQAGILKFICKVYINHHLILKIK